MFQFDNFRTWTRVALIALTLLIFAAPADIASGQGILSEQVVKEQAERAKEAIRSLGLAESAVRTDIAFAAGDVSLISKNPDQISPGVSQTIVSIQVNRGNPANFHLMFGTMRNRVEGSGLRLQLNSFANVSFEMKTEEVTLRPGVPALITLNDRPYFSIIQPAAGYPYGAASGLFQCGNLYVIVYHVKISRASVSEMKVDAIDPAGLALRAQARPVVLDMMQKVSDALVKTNACNWSDLTIDHIQVVQVIQDANNAVPLVAGKTTVARVFVKYTGNASKPVQVTGTLRGSRDGKTIQPKNGSITPQAKISRDNIDSSLNFWLPREWTTEGELTLEAEVVPPAESSSKTTVKGKTPAPLKFTRRNLLSVAYMPLCLQPVGTQDSVCTDDKLLEKRGEMLAKLYPVGDGELSYFGLAVPPKAWRKPFLTEQDNLALIVFLRKIYFLIDQTGADLFDQLTAWLPYDPSIKTASGVGDAIGGSPGATGRVSWAVDVSGVLNETSAQVLLAHEIGHALGLLHPGLPDSCDAAQARSGWRNHYTNSTIQEFGFDPVANKVIPSSFYDMMTYCDRTRNWISPYHYQRLFDGNLRPRAVEFQSSQNRFFGIATFKGEGFTSPFAAGLQASREYLIVSGTAKRDGSAGSLDPGFRVNSSTPAAPSESSGNHCLRFDGASGRLADHCFTLRFESHQTHSPIDEEPFSLKVPYPAATTRVSLTRGDKELAALTTGASAGAPSLSISSPRGDETWDGKHTISWSATNSNLTYAVLYSSDGGKTWLPLDVDLKESQVSLDTAKLKNGDRVIFRVLATDGLNTTTADSNPIRVNNQSALQLPSQVASFAPFILAGGVAIAAIALISAILLRRRPSPRPMPPASSSFRPANLPESGGPRKSTKPPTDLPQ